MYPENARDGNSCEGHEQRKVFFGRYLEPLKPLIKHSTLSASLCKELIARPTRSTGDRAEGNRWVRSPNTHNRMSSAESSADPPQCSDFHVASHGAANPAEKVNDHDNRAKQGERKMTTTLSHCRQDPFELLAYELLHRTKDHIVKASSLHPSVTFMLGVV